MLTAILRRCTKKSLRRRQLVPAQQCYGSDIRFYRNIGSNRDDNNNLMDPQQPDVLAALERLNHIQNILANAPNFPEPHLRDYVSIYIQSHKRSDEFFTTICEHKFLQLMLQQPYDPSSPTCYLQNLNLLLVNTKISSQLVYFLSQNCLHEYLFGTDILSQSGEFIEYYVQLIKTILMKLSENQENKSLIRLFCNNKYPTFPILTYSTLLATDSNELVKVTAQQCVLILVGMINDRDLYSAYLQELPMLAFFIKITHQYLNPEADHEGIIKYLADLIFELRRNKIPLLLLTNIISNVIITQSLPSNYALSLAFIQGLSQNIYLRIQEGPYNKKQSNRSAIFPQKQKKFTRSSYHKVKKRNSEKFQQYVEKDVCDQLLIICATFYRVLVKFMTQKYLNSCFLANMINLSPIGQPSNPGRIPVLSNHAQYKLFFDYLPKVYSQTPNCKSEIKFEGDVLDQIHDKIQEFSLCKDFIKLKDNYLKKGGNSKAGNNNGGFFGNFFKRMSNDYVHSQWLKAISENSSINFHKGALVSQNFPTCLSLTNCPFISELSFLKRILRDGNIKLADLKLGQELNKVQDNQIHMNDLRAMWALNQTSLNCLEKLTKHFVEFINEDDKFLVLPRLAVTPQYLFIIQIKQFLTTQMDSLFNSEDPKNIEFLHDYRLLIKMARVCSGLNIKLTERVFLRMGQQLNKLHNKLQAVFFQNGFEEAVSYLSFKMRRSRSDKSENDEEKYKPGKVFECLCAYQVMQKIMDPNIKSLGKYYEIAWKTANEDCIDGIALFEFEVNYFGKNGCKLVFLKSDKPPTIYVKVIMHGKTQLDADIMEIEDMRINKINNRVVQLGSSVETVRLSCTDQAEQVVQKFNQCKRMIMEAVTTAALEYLSVTHKMLHMESKALKPDRNALSFVTPE